MQLVGRYSRGTPVAITVPPGAVEHVHNKLLPDQTPGRYKVLFSKALFAVFSLVIVISPFAVLTLCT